ncbi:MAG: hypothetical protein CMH57_00480 [Myxococcales bacterium]|nr:hypothetical protein [Myxococcales bacterium]
MIWIATSVVIALGALWVLHAWSRGLTITALVRKPPREVDLPQFVTILGYLHHELIKHRLPLVRTVAERERDAVQPDDVALLKQVLTGEAERPSVVAELDGYLSGLQRASGSIHLNFWRDPLVRRTRQACQMIQGVADGLGERVSLTRGEHAQLRKADRILDGWFRPRLQALRNSVLILKLDRELLAEPINRVQRELGIDHVEAELPELDEAIQVRVLRHDFDLVLRNLIRNAIKASASHGTPKIAVEIATRLEMTGEESVLVRIHDTDPTMLNREQLYGGSIGRGLNLVTTTLRRYNASLRCVKSRREGFAKCLEVRLFRELADEAEAALLDERDPAGLMVPAVAGVVFLVGVAGLVAGTAGILPDPFEPTEPVVVADIDAGEPEVNVPEEDPKAPAPRRAVRRASAALHEALGGGRVAIRDSIKVPGPRDFSVDRRRCEPLLKSERLELNCRLINLDYRLEPPLLLLSDATDKHDFKRLEVSLEESIVEIDTRRGDRQLREVAEKERCARLKVLRRGQSLPSEVVQTLATITDLKGKPSRLLLDYRACLEQPRYPLRFLIRLSHPDAAAGAPATEIDLTIELRRREDAREAYARIANHGEYIFNPDVRRRLVTHIARHTADMLESENTSGSLPESSQSDLAQALYHGWVRPGLNAVVSERLEVEGGRRKATDGFCRLRQDISQGFKRMRELDEELVSTDLYRSEYFLHLSRLWQYNDVQGALMRLDRFQRRRARKTDFTQGARFYAALLLALGEPPKSDGVAGALNPENEDSEAERRLKGMVRLLRGMLRDARQPPMRGGEYDYTRIKLVGIRTLLGDAMLDEGQEVEDILCGFYEVHRAWADAMSTQDATALFGHCARFEPVNTPSLLDGPPDEEEEPDEPADGASGSGAGEEPVRKTLKREPRVVSDDEERGVDEASDEEEPGEGEEEEGPDKAPRQVRRLTLGIQKTSQYIERVTAMFQVAKPVCGLKSDEP